MKKFLPWFLLLTGCPEPAPTPFDTVVEHLGNPGAMQSDCITGFELNIWPIDTVAPYYTAGAVRVSPPPPPYRLTSMTVQQLLAPNFPCGGGRQVELFVARDGGTDPLGWTEVDAAGVATIPELLFSGVTAEGVRVEGNFANTMQKTVEIEPPIEITEAGDLFIGFRLADGPSPYACIIGCNGDFEPNWAHVAETGWVDGEDQVILWLTVEHDEPVTE